MSSISYNDLILGNQVAGRDYYFMINGSASSIKFLWDENYNTDKGALYISSSHGSTNNYIEIYEFTGTTFYYKNSLSTDYLFWSGSSGWRTSTHFDFEVAYPEYTSTSNRIKFEQKALIEFQYSGYNGSDISFLGGKAGSTDAPTSYANGGNAGNIVFTAGDGGDANSTYNAGNGGNIAFTAGLGGTAGGSGTNGSYGTITFTVNSSLVYTIKDGGIQLDGWLKLRDDDKIYFGTADDVYVTFDGTNMKIVTDNVSASDLLIDCGTNKTVRLVEDVWDDQQINISSVKLPTSNAPSWTDYHGSQVLAFGEGTDNIIYFTAQLSHKYKEGGDIEFHIHYAIETDGSGGGAENVKWDFTYAWSNINGAISVVTGSTITFDVQNQVDDTHYLGEIVATISGATKSISSILLCSLKRDTSVADNYGADAYLLAADFHIPLDTIGSRQEAVK